MNRTAACATNADTDDAVGEQITALLRKLFARAVESAQPEHCLPPMLPAAPAGRTVVIGAGKAAATMARVVEQHWTGPLSGLVITRYGHAAACDRIAVCEAGHPLPDTAGQEATRKMLALLGELTADDLVLCLISGGGSSLLVAPPPGVDLGEIRVLTERLLRSGATISQINCVRKHLSMVAGGRLAQWTRPARLVTLAISDVPGDDPATIASGPTVADTSTSEEALAILDLLAIEPGPGIRRWLNGKDSETPKPGQRESGNFHIVASPQKALQAAADAASEAGYAPLILGSAIEGEARDVALVHAGIAMQAKQYGQPAKAPCIILSGGETSVTVRGSGRGGRNGEFLLALLVALNGEPGIHALAADTDGIDGTEANAGAIIGPTTLATARTLGISPAEALAQSDSHGFFEAVGGLLVTGPTRTNVNDFRAIAIGSVPAEGQ